MNNFWMGYSAASLAAVWMAIMDDLQESPGDGELLNELQSVEEELEIRGLTIEEATNSEAGPRSEGGHSGEAGEEVPTLQEIFR